MTYFAQAEAREDSMVNLKYWRTATYDEFRMTNGRDGRLAGGSMHRLRETCCGWSLAPDTAADHSKAGMIIRANPAKSDHRNVMNQMPRNAETERALRSAERNGEEIFRAVFVGGEISKI